MSALFVDSIVFWSVTENGWNWVCIYICVCLSTDVKWFSEHSDDKSVDYLGVLFSDTPLIHFFLYKQFIVLVLLLWHDILEVYI